MRILYLPNQYSQQRQRQKPSNIFPIRMAMEATYRAKCNDVAFDRQDLKNWSDRIITEPEGIDFSLLPKPDRRMTNAFHPKFQDNGNFKHFPGAYTMAAGGCWYGLCSFCIEKGTRYVVRSVHSVIEEISELMILGFKEIFDDSATFPDGKWLMEFCQKKINLGLTIPFSCNMRIGADVDFKLMKKAGFRMLLYGIESTNSYTLKKIKKGINLLDVLPTLKAASKEGLEPHVAVMVGYPWEIHSAAEHTINFVHHLLKKGYAKTAQASVYCVDGKKNDEYEKYVKKIYDIAWSPEFWWNKVRDIRSMADFNYLIRGIKEGLR